MKIRDYKIDDKINIDGMEFRVGLETDMGDMTVLYDYRDEEEVYTVVDDWNEEYDEDVLFFVRDVDCDEFVRGIVFLVYAKSSLEAKLRVIKTLIDTNSVFYNPVAYHTAYPLDYILPTVVDGNYANLDIKGAKEAYEAKDKVNKETHEAYVAL